MLPAVRHFEDASATPVCSIWEADGAAGGPSMLWSMVHACTTPQTSLIILPQLMGAKEHSVIGSKKDIARATVVCMHDDGDAHSEIMQAVEADGERNPKIRRRLVILESASTLSIMRGFGALTKLLVDLTSSSHVHGIVVLLQKNVHSQDEINRVHRLCTCTFLIKPVQRVPEDQVLARTAIRVHVEGVLSLLRHSGRVRIDTVGYFMMASGQLSHCLNGSPDAKISDACVPHAELEREGDHLQSKFEKDMSGFMKLTLSARDKQHRKSVVLPWQHDGMSSMPALDQHGKESTGVVHYLRDSDHDCDSDEDPDDDLDL